MREAQWDEAQENIPELIEIPAQQTGSLTAMRLQLVAISYPEFPWWPVLVRTVEVALKAMTLGELNARMMVRVCRASAVWRVIHRLVVRKNRRQGVLVGRTSAPSHLPMLSFVLDRRSLALRSVINARHRRGDIDILWFSIP